MAVFLGRESSTPQCMALALELSEPLSTAKTRPPAPGTTAAYESKPWLSLRPLALCEHLATPRGR